MTIASIQLTSGPNIQANLHEVSRYLKDISKTNVKNGLIIKGVRFALLAIVSTFSIFVAIFSQNLVLIVSNTWA